MSELQEQEKIAEKWFQRWRHETVYVFSLLLIAALVYQQWDRKQENTQWRDDFKALNLELKYERARNEELHKELDKAGRDIVESDQKNRETLDKALDVVLSRRSGSPR